MIIEYTCKFCRRPGSVESDIKEITLQVKAWQAMLACDRCADFQVSKRGIRDKIYHVIQVFLRLREIDSVPSQTATAIRDKLGQLTKRFATVVCSFHHKPYFWEPDFVDFILEKPEMTGSILTKYEHTVRTAR